MTLKKLVARLIGSAALAVLGASSAAAQWIHEQGEDDPFAGGAQHMALTVSSLGEGVIFRCTSQGDLALLYISLEKPDAAEAKIFAKMPAKLLVIVDDDPKQEYAAMIDTTPDGGRYRFTAVSPDLAPLARRAATAKKRLAIAVELLGKRVYSAAVNVRGSKVAIGRLANGCKLP